MKTGTHTQVPVPMTIWHELRDHQEYSKKIAMKTGTHTQVLLPLHQIIDNVLNVRC